MYEVAEMRDPCGGTPPASVVSTPDLFTDEDDAEISKDGGPSRSSASSYRSSHADSQQPYQKFLHFLYGKDGITRFLADMCCDTTDFPEPQTHELKRKSHHRGLSPDITDNANSIRKTYSSGRLANRKKKAANVRSQTAPRQRTSSDSFPSSGMVESPRTARSSFADGRSSSFHDRRSKQRIHQGDRRMVSGSNEQFSRSALNLAGPGDLPPLPRQRPKSTVSRPKLSAVVG